MGNRNPVGGIDRSKAVDRISLQTAVETPFCMAVWETQPKRKIEVSMTYGDLQIICDLIEKAREERKE